MKNLGIDIGGTSIKGGLVDQKGEITNLFSLPIDKKLNQEDQIAALISKIKESYKEDDFSGIGLGIPGTINPEEGLVLFSNNLDWHELAIGDMFKKAFPNKKITMDNDANVAALGEVKFGVAKNEKNVVLITLGTGVGSGIIIDGKVYEGENGRGAEIGHSLLVMDGIKCTCGRKGCLEMYASASALIRQADEACKSHPNSRLAKAKLNGELDGKTIFEIAQKGCKTAQKVVNNYVKFLSEGLINICNVFRPSTIVLSGGIANQGSYLIDKIESYLDENNYGFPPKAKVNIRCSMLGYNSGIIGAASLLF